METGGKTISERFALCRQQPARDRVKSLLSPSFSTMLQRVYMSDSIVRSTIVRVRTASQRAGGNRRSEVRRICMYLHALYKHHALQCQQHGVLQASSS